MGKNEVLEKLEEVEELRNAYKIACENRLENSDYTINAFHEWYLAAVELFCEVLGEDDQLLQKFRTTDISGDGFTLRDVYRSLSSDYISLKVRVKNYDKQNGKNEISGQAEIGMQMVKIKPKKIFISHSHEDEEFVLALVDLLHDIGFEYEEIFCSSVPACSIPEGKSIFDEIRAQFEKHDLFVIFIHSPRFYASHISMNEMGAAWVLRSDYSSFLTKDMTTDLMRKAVVQDDRIYVKIGDKQAPYRLNEWQERILKFFGKPAVKMNAWMQDSAKFLKKVSNLTYPESSTDESKPKQDSLSDEDKRRLHCWVNSNDVSMYFSDYTGGGGIVVLGSVEYPIKSARDKTEWYEYFKRLLSLGLVEYLGSNGNNPVYQLTAKAYKYFD